MSIHVVIVDNYFSPKIQGDIQEDYETFSTFLGQFVIILMFSIVFQF